MENVALNNRDLPLLVLASTSPRRKELIQLLGLQVEVVSSSADETVEMEWSPAETVEQLALRKATEVADARKRKSAQEIVIGADTIVVCDQQILGKPQDQDDAYHMLSMLRHRKTQVWMRPLSDDQIMRYIASGEPLDKAGAYGIQGRGAAIVDRIDGCYFTVVGLPIALLSEMLSVYGVETP